MAKVDLLTKEEAKYVMEIYVKCISLSRCRSEKRMGNPHEKLSSIKLDVSS